MFHAKNIGWLSTPSYVSREGFWMVPFEFIPKHNGQKGRRPIREWGRTDENLFFTVGENECYRLRCVFAPGDFVGNLGWVLKDLALGEKDVEYFTFGFRLDPPATVIFIPTRQVLEFTLDGKSFASTLSIRDLASEGDSDEDYIFSLSKGIPKLVPNERVRRVRRRKGPRLGGWKTMCVGATPGDI